MSHGNVLADDDLLEVIAELQPFFARVRTEVRY